MKKLYTLIFFFATTLTALAQTDESLQFVDKDGNTVANGTTVTITEGEVVGDDEWAYIQFPTGLYVKNTTTDNVYASVTYTIKSLANGAFQICFPINCVQKSETGTFSTEAGMVAPNEAKDLMSEWIVEEVGMYGTTEVDYQLVTYDYNPMTQVYTPKGFGPKITVNFNYSTMSVDTIGLTDTAVTSRYSVNGQRLASPQKGINIVKLGNGKVVKHVQ